MRLEKLEKDSKSVPKHDAETIVGRRQNSDEVISVKVTAAGTSENSKKNLKDKTSGKVGDNIHASKDALLEGINDLKDLAKMRYDKKTNKLINTGQLSNEKIAAILAKAKSDIISEHKIKKQKTREGVKKDFFNYEYDYDEDYDDLDLEYNDDEDEPPKNKK